MKHYIQFPQEPCPCCGYAPQPSQSDDYTDLHFLQHEVKHRRRWTRKLFVIPWREDAQGIECKKCRYKWTVPIKGAIRPEDRVTVGMNDVHLPPAHEGCKSMPMTMSDLADSPLAQAALSTSSPGTFGSLGEIQKKQEELLASAKSNPVAKRMKGKAASHLRDAIDKGKHVLQKKKAKKPEEGTFLYNPLHYMPAPNPDPIKMPDHLRGKKLLHDGTEYEGPPEPASPDVVRTLMEEAAKAMSNQIDKDIIFGSLSPEESVEDTAEKLRNESRMLKSELEDLREKNASLDAMLTELRIEHQVLVEKTTIADEMWGEEAREIDSQQWAKKERS